MMLFMVGRRGVMSDHSRTAANQMNVRYVANLARLRLTDAEAEEFQGQLARIVDYFNELRGLDLDKVEPMAHTMMIQNVFREDVSQPGLAHEVVMANAPQESSGLFVVPKIVE
jgi:aspartyl-tRNA(Asn)/glutamyl-tRNA(Gln) amidotransferase subunit C